jgi:hypothetical protein
MVLILEPFVSCSAAPGEAGGNLAGAASAL